MDHSVALIETIAIGLVAAFIGGMVAARLRIPTIVGYLVAGVVIGPFTPGLVADTGTAAELTPVSEIGEYRFTPGKGCAMLIDAYSAEVQPKRAAAE